MAAYPTLPVRLGGSNDTPRAGIKTDITGDGYARGRKVHDDVHDWTLVHEKLTDTQYTTLMSHYDAHGRATPPLTFSFTSPFKGGGTYTARYLDRPMPTEEEGGYVTMTVKLTQA